MAFPWTLVSTLGGGLLSGIFGSSNASKNRQSQTETNQTNLRIARENNQTSMDLMREANDFNAHQADLAWDRQQQMFNMENAYNSPLEVVKRLTEANINPQAAFDGGASSYASAASGATPSGGASSVGIPNLTSPHLDPVQYGLNPFESIIQGVASAASAQKMISDAKRSGVDTKLAESTLDDAIMAYREDVKAKRLDNLKSSIETDLLYKFGDKIKTAELDAMLEDINNKILQGDNIRADTYKKNSEGFLTQLTAQEKEEYNKYLDQFVAQALQLGREQIATQRSQQSANYASAAHSFESVKTEKATQFHLSELAKMSKAQRLQIIENSITLYEDETGVKMSSALRGLVRMKMLNELNLSIESLRKHVRQQGSDYWNPFRYVGNLLGGSATEVAKKALK